MDRHHHHHHLHRELAKRKPEDVTQEGTVYSIVYVTASPTFTGIIGGYTTLTEEPSSQQTEASSASTSAQVLTAPVVVSTAAASSDAAETSEAVFSIDESSTAVFASIESVASQSSAFTSAVQLTAPATWQTYSTATTAAFTSASSAAAADDGSSLTESVIVPSASVSASDSVSDSSLSSDTSSTSDNSGSSGMSTGAKAGTAIGVIAAVGLLAVFLLWFLGKKRRQREADEQAYNEKADFDLGRPAGPIIQAPPAAAAHDDAPRLSLRPVSRMMDGFLGANNRRSGQMLTSIGEDGRAVGHGLGPGSTSQASTPTSLQEKQPLENPFADPQNPFQDPPTSVVAPGQALPRAPGPAPIVAPVAAKLSDNTLNANNTVAPQSNDVDASMSPIQVQPAATAAAFESTVAKTLAAAGVAGAAGVAVAAHNGSSAARSPSPTESLPVQKPASPEPSREKDNLASSATTVPSALSSPALSGSSDAPPGGNVFRVLMDFSPSMDDELELKTGQLIRLLHEYDDGWALCIRLDRSQQGVVPRTCLAAKPSKPKPSHLNQYARGPGPHARPMSPAGVPLPLSPATRNGRPASPGMGRPMSPGMGRPMSPGMGRPMSPGMGRPMSATGGRPMGPPRPIPGRPGSQTQSRPMSPGAYNQAPRPLSPGPRPYKRSQSPGPYGMNGPAPMHDVEQRRRSNSASAVGARDRRTSPLGPSNLGPASRPLGQPLRPMSPGIAL